MYKNDGYVRRYSESFKLKILAELTKGNHSKRQIALTYGVQSSTINVWIKKYDRKDLMNTRVMVETKDEFYLDQTFINTAHAKRATKNGINLYNEIRLHLSLDFKNTLYGI